ncbi:hypothetical protein LCGC14_1060890 [marine sediment metagenome]|uniref:Uncharacterized protein n=1 Tax=marine sediment metagenome TaxID=412755 RepID=A0A0F9QS07_9ZZZZ
MNNKIEKFGGSHDEYVVWLKNRCNLFAGQLKCNPDQRTCRKYPCDLIKMNPLWKDREMMEDKG